MTLRRIFIALFLLVLASTTSMAQGDRESTVMHPRVLRPSEYLYTDSLGGTTRGTESGAVYTLSRTMQDSLFQEALKVDITAAARFAAMTRMLQSSWEAQQAMKREPSAWEFAMATMDIPAEMLQPSGQEMTQRAIAIANSMHVPGVLIRPMGTGNLQVRLADIYRMLGITEDVSPRVVYDVEEATNIEIVIYSAQARVINTIFRGGQLPGRYEIVWNGRDDQGRTVANGDYIAEVRFGTTRLQRKRIVWPPTE
jgi:hypothetical protein